MASNRVWVVVLRAFETEGERLLPGEMVEASTWPSPRRDQLTQQRRIRPATAQEVDAAEAELAAEAAPPVKAKRARR